MTRKGNTTNTEMQWFGRWIVSPILLLTDYPRSYCDRNHPSLRPSVVPQRLTSTSSPLLLRSELLDAIPALDVCGSFKASPSIHLCNHLRNHQANSRIGVYYSTRNTTILGIFGIPSLPLFVRIFLLPTGLYMHPMMMMAAKADLWHSVLERFGCDWLVTM